jgi:hypothetical protein
MASLPHGTFLEWLAYFELKAEDEDKAMKKAQAKSNGNTTSLI